MPELENVETQKTAGFVNSKYRNKRREKIEQEEKELEALMSKQENPEDDTEENPEENKAQENSQEPKEEDSKEDDKLSAEEKSYKKRYGDLRRHAQKKEQELQTQIDELKEQMKNSGTVRPPKSDEDLQEWQNKYPDVASIVETIAQKKAKEMFDQTETKIQEFDNYKYEMERAKVERKISEAHPDFDELREDDKFHDWAEEQPKWVQDALYENSDDANSVIRVIDLYKSDKGMTSRDKKRKEKEAASTVDKGSRTKPEADGNALKIKESDVAKMSLKEYEKREDEINEAMSNGNFIYDISGGAR